MCPRFRFAASRGHFFVDKRPRAVFDYDAPRRQLRQVALAFIRPCCFRCCRTNANDRNPQFSAEDLSIELVKGGAISWSGVRLSDCVVDLHVETRAPCGRMPGARPMPTMPQTCAVTCFANPWKRAPEVPVPDGP